MIIFVSLIGNFIVNVSSQVTKGIVTLILLGRLIRNYIVLQDTIQLFSQDVRRIFNRSRSRQKEKNLDITYISCNYDIGVSLSSSCVGDVMARKCLGECMEE